MPSFKNPKVYTAHRSCLLQLLRSSGKKAMLYKIGLFFTAFVVMSLVMYHKRIQTIKFVRELQTTTYSYFVRQDLVSYMQDAKQSDEQLIQAIIQKIKKPQVDSDLAHIFKGDLSNNDTWEFDFSEVSKRRFGRTFIEQTSYDPEARNTDMHNPVRFDDDGLVLFEDFGPGICQKIAFSHRLNIRKTMENITLEVDGSVIFTTTVVRDKAYPFQDPFIRPNSIKDPGIGYYLPFPVPYAKSLRVKLAWYSPAELHDEQWWNISIMCRKENTRCPDTVFYGVVANKLVHGAGVKSFGQYFPENSNNPKTKILKAVTSTVSEMAKSPEVYGPGMKSGCKLNCQKHSSGSTVQIYSANVAKVIQSMLFRVYDIERETPFVSENWKRVLITMTWDGKEPQVNEIPLAGLFISGMEFLREVRSLTAGFKKTTCDMQGDRSGDVEPRDWLAFLLYEMPFWQSAKITIRIPADQPPAMICSHVSTKELNLDKYHPLLTGYFSAQLNQQPFDFLHYKTMLRLENQWGQVVGINHFMNNYKVASTHELDIIIETDGANLPVYSGTGFEDFYNYFHLFKGYYNTSSAFNGIPFIYRNRWDKFKSYKCYRHMLFDPILFTTGIHIYLEPAQNRKKIFRPRKFLPSSSSFNQKLLRDSLLTVVLFYGNKGPGGITTDNVSYADWDSSEKFQFTPQDVHNFSVCTMFENEPSIKVNRTVVSLNPGQRVIHMFKVAKNNVGVILRREYRTVVPNQKAEVKVDGEHAGIWFCPQRALTEEYSLRLQDYLLSPEQTTGKESIQVELKAITRWETTSIKVVSVVLKT